MPSGSANTYSHRSAPLSLALMTIAMPSAITNWTGTIATITSRVVPSARVKAPSLSTRWTASRL